MTAIQNNINVVANSDILSTGVTSAGHLTTEGLVMYLAERLSGVDDQINTIMTKQKATENARKHIAEIQNIYAKYKGGQKMSVEDRQRINYHLQLLGDAALANKLSSSLGFPMNPISETKNYRPELPMPPKDEGLNIGTGTYQKAAKLEQTDIDGAETLLGNTIKEFESSAQLDMIQLQSLMSARNSAISLATNMMSAIGKGLESIVGNIGR